MENLLYSIAGILIPFVGTSLGSSLVFFMKKNINEKFQKALDLMTNDEINQYQKYIDDCYSFARAQELNLKSTKPILPYGFDKVLEVV